MMRKILLSIVGIACYISLSAADFVYHDASKYLLLGKASKATTLPYARLDDSVKEKTRVPVWDLSLNSAGMAIRFASNSTAIGVRYKSLLKREMNHMTPTGIRGVDLYCLMDDGHWQFVCSGRPSCDKIDVDATIISNMDRKMREYMLYLPLYDGLDSLYIGVDKDSEIMQPQKQLPKRERPVVMYGTSILQGGCASRPGMSHTNILMRCLNREVYNFGFSGNGQLDLEIAEEIAKIENPGLYVIDCLPNCTSKQLEEKLYKFFMILRKAHSDVPVLFVGSPIFPHSYFNRNVSKTIGEKNEVLYRLFAEFKKKGNKNIYLFKGEDVLGKETDATVDGIHFTDYGFAYYAKHLLPVIKKIGSFK